MTVADFIKELQKLPQDVKIVHLNYDHREDFEEFSQPKVSEIDSIQRIRYKLFFDKNIESNEQVFVISSNL